MPGPPRSCCRRYCRKCPGLSPHRRLATRSHLEGAGHFVFADVHHVQVVGCRAGESHTECLAGGAAPGLLCRSCWGEPRLPALAAPLPAPPAATRAVPSDALSQVWTGFLSEVACECTSGQPSLVCFKKQSTNMLTAKREKPKLVCVDVAALGPRPAKRILVSVNYRHGGVYVTR